MSEIPPQHKPYAYGETYFALPPRTRRTGEHPEEVKRTTEATDRHLVTHPNVAKEMKTTGGKPHNDLDNRNTPQSRGRIKGYDNKDLFGTLTPDVVARVNRELYRDAEEEDLTTRALHSLGKKALALQRDVESGSRKERKVAEQPRLFIGADIAYLDGRLKELSLDGDEEGGLDSDAIHDRTTVRDNVVDRFAYATRKDGTRNIDVLHREAIAEDEERNTHQ